MSVRQTQAAVDSGEFAEWMAFYGVEREAMGGEQERLPTPDELSTKMTAFAAELAARSTGMSSR